MFISRTRARSWWVLLVCLAGIGAAWTIGTRSGAWYGLIAGALAFPVCAIGWMFPRTLQRAGRVLHVLVGILTRAARGYVAALLYLVIASAGMGRARKLSDGQRASRWVERGPESVHVREGKPSDSSYAAVRACTATQPPALRFALTSFGWILKHFPAQPFSGRIPYGNYTLQ